MSISKKTFTVNFSGFVSQVLFPRNFKRINNLSFARSQPFFVREIPCFHYFLIVLFPSVFFRMAKPQCNNHPSCLVSRVLEGILTIFLILIILFFSSLTLTVTLFINQYFFLQVIKIIRIYNIQNLPLGFHCQFKVSDALTDYKTLIHSCIGPKDLKNFPSKDVVFASLQTPLILRIIVFV